MSLTGTVTWTKIEGANGAFKIHLAREEPFQSSQAVKMHEIVELVESEGRQQAASSMGLLVEARQGEK